MFYNHNKKLIQVIKLTSGEEIEKNDLGAKQF
jgi:hypothetical protein